jgi:predicted small lipoprotein YifL
MNTDKIARSSRAKRALPILALVLLTTLAACGKNGVPVLPNNTTGKPSDDNDNYNRQYPTSTAPQQGVFN